MSHVKADWSFWVSVVLCSVEKKVVLSCSYPHSFISSRLHNDPLPFNHTLLVSISVNSPIELEHVVGGELLKET